MTKEQRKARRLGVIESKEKSIWVAFSPKARSASLLDIVQEPKI